MSGTSSNSLQNSNIHELDADDTAHYLLNQIPAAIRQHVKDYKIFKSDRVSLLSDLLSNGHQIQVIVAKWIRVYANDQIDAMKQLMQLIVNLSPNYELDIDEMFAITSLKEYDYEEITDYLEMNPTDMQASLNCIFNRTNKFGEEFLKVFASFVYKLMQRVHCNGILYDGVFSLFIERFLLKLVNSTTRTIRLTAVTCIVKLYTGLLLIVHMNGELDEEKKSFLMNIMGKCLNVFQRNICLCDTKVLNMRIICFNEMHLWIKLNDPILLDYNISGMLKQHLNDMTIELRCAALQTVCIIIQSYFAYFERYRADYDRIFEEINGRLSDVSQDVRLEAFKVIMACYKRKMDINSIEIIIKLMFSKNQVEAMEAGKVYNAYLLTKRDTFERFEDILKVLLNVMYAGRDGLFIEILVYTSPLMKRINLLIISLINNDFDELEQEHKVIELIYHVIDVMVNGKSHFNRLKDIQKIGVPVAVYRSIGCKCLVLLKKYENAPKCREFLLKTLILLKDYLGNSELYAEELSEVAYYVSDLFMEENDETILVFIKTYIENAQIRDCFDMIQNGLSLTENELEFHKKVAVLYKQFDVRDKYDWNMISGDLIYTETQFNSVQNQFAACCSYLKHFSNDDVYITKYNQIHTKFFELIDEIKNVHEFYEILSIFEDLKTFFMHIENELTEDLKCIVINPFTAQQCALLTDKLIDLCLNVAEEVNIESQNACLVAYLKLLLMGFIRSEEFHRIFKYYVKIENRSVFNDFLREFSKESKAATANLLLQSLKLTEFHNLPKNDLDNLAEEAINCFPLTYSPTLLLYALQATQQDQSIAHILTFYKYFIGKLKANDKATVQSYFQQRFISLLHIDFIKEFGNVVNN